MDKQIIYRKTRKGQDEMATRAYELPARVRSVLVLVDGKRSAAELIEKGRHFGDSAEFLRQLVESGFIESVTAIAAKEAPKLAQPVVTPPRPAPPPAKRVVPKAALPIAPSMAHTISFARLFLREALGPDADSLTAPIESSRNLRELTAALEKSRDALIALAGRRKADVFWEEINARLPTGG